MVDMRRIERTSIQKEIEYAEDANHHRSVRVITLKRVLAATDRKTDALKAIHRICNGALDAGEWDWKMLKEIRQIASGAWPELASEQ